VFNFNFFLHAGQLVSTQSEFLQRPNSFLYEQLIKRYERLPDSLASSQCEVSKSVKKDKMVDGWNVVFPSVYKEGGVAMLRMSLFGCPCTF